MIAPPPVIQALILQFLRRFQYVEKPDPACVDIGRNRDPAIGRLEWLPRRVHLALVADRAIGRNERVAIKVLFEKEVCDTFEHRHFDMNCLTRPVPLSQCG